MQNLQFRALFPLAVVLTVSWLVALSASAGDLYWVYTHPSNGAEVMTSDLDGSNISLVVSIPDTSALGTSTAEDIDLDVANGKFYIEVQDFNDAKIYRGNLDGSDFEELTTVTLNGGQGLGLDSPNDRLYFSEAAGTANRLYRSALDGSGQTAILSGPLFPAKLAMDLDNGHIYFQDGNTGVQRSNLDGTGVTLIIGRTAINQGIAVDPAAGFLYYAQLFDVYRSNLDGSGETPLFSMQAGDSIPNDMFIDKANAKLYLASNNVIVRTNLDGTGYVRIIGPSATFPNPLSVAVLQTSQPVPSMVVPFLLVCVLGAVAVGMLSRRRA